MRPWIAVWLALAAAHVVFLALGLVVGSVWLVPVVVGTIYLPLWPLGKLGVPVIQLSGSTFAQPTAAGWAAIVISWSLVYRFIAIVIVRLLDMRRADDRVER
jgi:hypothetical protein